MTVCESLRSDSEYYHQKAMSIAVKHHVSVKELTDMVELENLSRNVNDILESTPVESLSQDVETYTGGVF